MSLAVVIPLRDFSLAKVRLRSRGVEDVTALARSLAAGVVRACAPRPVYVVTESDDVEVFARDMGATVLRSPVSSLNAAVAYAYQSLEGRYDQLMFVHGDLKHPAGLGAFEPTSGVTIFTDDRAEGTNVLVVPTGLDFHFAFGTSSNLRHAREAKRLALALTTVSDSLWRFDVDEPTDL